MKFKLIQEEVADSIHATFEKLQDEYISWCLNKQGQRFGQYIINKYAEEGEETWAALYYEESPSKAWMMIWNNIDNDGYIKEPE